MSDFLAIAVDDRSRVTTTLHPGPCGELKIGDGYVYFANLDSLIRFCDAAESLRQQWHQHLDRNVGADR